MLLVLWEVFETVVLPRKIDRKFRVTRYYYLAAWGVCCFLADRITSRRRKAAFLAIFGPFSLLGLFAVWGITLAFAFAVLTWSMHSPFKPPEGEAPSFLLDLYVSGTTLTTLGLGDVTPRSPAARLGMVIEAALGFGLVALVISYLPALYQAFSRREAEISLLDARAGSPPSAAELLHRCGNRRHWQELERFLGNWERWCAEIMESHISYPVLCYFRSQHTNQSWVTAITAILDCCALCTACVDDETSAQARLTFAMARHAVVDITQVFQKKPATNVPARLSREGFQAICDDLRTQGWMLHSDRDAWDQLTHTRELYEPYVVALSQILRMDLAPWSHPEGVKDNWVTTKWQTQRGSQSH